MSARQKVRIFKAIYDRLAGRTGRICAILAQWYFAGRVRLAAALRAVQSMIWIGLRAHSGVMIKSALPSRWSAIF